MLPTNTQNGINTNAFIRPSDSNSSIGESSKVSNVVGPVLKECKLCRKEKSYTSKAFYGMGTSVEKCRTCYSSLEAKDKKRKKEDHFNFLYGPNGIYRTSSCSNTSRSDTPFISIDRSSVPTPVSPSPLGSESVPENNRDISTEKETRKRSLSPETNPMLTPLRRKPNPEPSETFLWEDLEGQEIAGPGPSFIWNPDSEDLG